MLSSDKRFMQSRFSFDEEAQKENFQYKLDIASSKNLVAHVIKHTSSELINDYKEVKWRNYMTRDLSDLIENGAFCITPIQINKKTLGIIIGQRLNQPAKITQAEFERFCFLNEHLNMCLSIITQR